MISYVDDFILYDDMQDTRAEPQFNQNATEIAVVDDPCQGQRKVLPDDPRDRN